MPRTTLSCCERHAAARRRDVLRESARAEFEAARYEDDPEIVRQLLLWWGLMRSRLLVDGAAVMVLQHSPVAHTRRRAP